MILREKGKEGHFTKIGRVQRFQEDIILKVCALNNMVSKYIKQELLSLQVEIDKSIIIMGDF